MGGNFVVGAEKGTGGAGNEVWLLLVKLLLASLLTVGYEVSEA